jgi:hypothetical protein
MSYVCVYRDGSLLPIGDDDYHNFGCPPENDYGSPLAEVDDASQVGTGQPAAIVLNVPPTTAGGDSFVGSAALNLLGIGLVALLFFKKGKR